MIRFFILVVGLMVGFSSLQAQKISEGYLQKAEELRQHYEKDDVVLLKNKSEFTFNFNVSSQIVQVKETEDYQYLALNSRASFTKRIYFNDHVKINSYSIKSDRGKNLDHEKFCGHYESDGIFYSDAQVCGYMYDMPQKGSFVNFTSEKTYDDPRYLTKVFFHDEHPSEYREIVIHVPANVEVEIVEFNFDNYRIEKEVETTDGEQNYQTYRYSITDLDTYPRDENVPGYSHFLPHLVILTKSYQVGAETKKILSCTDDVYDWYASLVDRVKNDQTSLEEIVEKVISHKESDEEKIKSIYYWVQDNIKYIAFEDGLAAYVPEDAQTVFYNRYGDCKGMANITKAMLKIAGFDARLTWIGTNSLPYTYDIPSLAVDNHMICYVLAGDKRYILDATEKYNPINLNAERIQGKQILVENGKSYFMDSIPREPLARYLESNDLVYTLSENGLNVTGKAAYIGEYKKILMNVRQIIKSEDEEKFIKTLVSGDAKLDHVDIKSFSPFDRDKALEINYEVSLSKNVNVFDNETYLDFDFNKDFMNYEMEDDRESPFFFDSRVNRRMIAEMALPAGTTLSYKPENLTIETDYYKFNLQYELKENKLFYTKEIQIFNNILPVSEFENWNSAIVKLNDFYNEQIILKTSNQ